MATCSSGAFTCTLSAQSGFLSFGRFRKIHQRNPRLLSVRASSDDPECNDDECAPDKEVNNHTYTLSFSIGNWKLKFIGHLFVRERLRYKNYCLSI